MKPPGGFLALMSGNASHPGCSASPLIHPYWLPVAWASSQHGGPVPRPVNRERGRWEQHCLSWPSLIHHTASLSPHSVMRSSLRPTRFQRQGRGNRLQLSEQPYGSRRPCGTRDVAMTVFGNCNLTHFCPGLSLAMGYPRGMQTFSWEK